MSFTAFPNGVSSYGVPLVGGGRANGKKHWFVQGNTGNNGNPGDSPEEPFLTMAKAFAVIGSGDTIHFTGNIREQLSTPVGIFDVTIIGEGNRPRHADAHTGNNGYFVPTWKQPSSPTAATPLLTVRQQGWRVINVLFSGAPAATPAIRLFRDAGAGDAERDGSHFHMIDCRVDGAPIGVQNSGGVAWVTIERSIFRGMTTSGIGHTAGAGVGTLILWRILDNVFQDNAYHILAPLNQGLIKGNTFGKFTTKSVDLTGGVGYNMVTQNLLSGTYSTAAYVSADTTDAWGGNFNVITGGVTAALPAA